MSAPTRAPEPGMVRLTLHAHGAEVEGKSPSGTGGVFLGVHVEPGATAEATC